MQFLVNEPLHPSAFVEAHTGFYFVPPCSTYNECERICREHKVYLSEGYKLSEINKVPGDMACVLVDFSTEEDYTKYDWRIMTIQKRYLNKFKKNLKEIVQEG